MEDDEEEGWCLSSRGGRIEGRLCGGWRPGRRGIPWWERGHQTPEKIRWISRSVRHDVTGEGSTRGVENRQSWGVYANPGSGTS